MTRTPFKRDSIRLDLEELAAREAPGSLFGDTDVKDGDRFAGPLMQEVVRVNQAPSISNFRAIVGPNGQVTFAGTVTDDQAVAGYIVRIVGAGVDTSAIVQNDGTFRVTIEVHAPRNITVAATVTDAFGANGAPAYTTFTPSN